MLTTVYVKISHFNKQTHPWETCTFQMKTSLLNALFAFGTLTYAAENRDLAPQHKIVQPYTINVDFSDCGACCQAGCGFSGAIRFFNNPPPDVADTQTEQTAFRNDQHNSSSTITRSSYSTHQRLTRGVPDAHASDLHSVESESKHHLTEVRREGVISAGCMEAVKTWKYHWSGRAIDRNT